MIDIASDSYIAAPRKDVVSVLTKPAFWHECDADLDVTPYHDRGIDGMRWYLGGALVGTAEVWLEPYWDGTLVHVYVRAEPAPRTSRRRGRPRIRFGNKRRRLEARLKQALFRVKDTLETAHRKRPSLEPSASRSVVGRRATVGGDPSQSPMR